MNNETKVLTLKQKIFKTIFYLSFIPYILFIIATISAMIFGVGFMFDYVYGFTALVVMGIVAYFYLPLFVVCLIYQIVFKIVTRNKAEYKQYNFKNFLLIIVISVVSIIVISVVYNVVSSLIYKYSYHTRGYGDTNIIVVPYSDAYENELNTTTFVDYFDLFDYITKHIDDLWEYIDTYQCNYTSYVISVSDVIDGSVEIIDNPKLEISDGLEKSRITVYYSKDGNIDERNVILCITDSFSFESYDTYTVWVER